MNKFWEWMKKNEYLKYDDDRGRYYFEIKKHGIRHNLPENGKSLKCWLKSIHPDKEKLLSISLLGWKLKYLLFYGHRVDINWTCDIYNIINKVDRRIEGMINVEL